MTPPVFLTRRALASQGAIAQGAILAGEEIEA
jgi:hypothetical protein